MMQEGPVHHPTKLALLTANFFIIIFFNFLDLNFRFFRRGERRVVEIW